MSDFKAKWIMILFLCLAAEVYICQFYFCGPREKWPLWLKITFRCFDVVFWLAWILVLLVDVK